MKKIIFIALIAILVLGGMTLFGRSRTDKPVINAASGILSIDRASHDFGRISMGAGNVSTAFIIQNNTSTDILVEKITTSCMCTVAYISGGDGRKGPFGMPGHGGPAGRADEIIRSGESREIEIVFDPAAHGPAGVGKVERIIYLEDSLGRVTEFKFSALVTP